MTVEIDNEKEVPRPKRCRICGRVFYGSSDTAICLHCRQERDRRSTGQLNDRHERAQEERTDKRTGRTEGDDGTPSSV